MTRGGSRWINTAGLIERINRESVIVSASTPNNLSEIIANGTKSLNRGDRYAPTRQVLASMLGVTRQTLRHWDIAEVIDLDKREYSTGKKMGGKMVKKYGYDLKSVLNGLMKFYKSEQPK